MSSVEIQHLTKSFICDDLVNPNVLALTDINVSIADGELAILLGPGNCGKTTLLKILAGLEKPDNGDILIDEQDSSFLPKAARPMVFSKPTTFPWLTVRQNIEFGLRLRKMSSQDIKERTDHYIELVGLNSYEKHLPRSLSKGTNQQVAIARAMALQPQVLLMDEPFNMLDAQTRMRLQEMLLKIQRQERCTIIFSTHDIDEAILLGTTIHMMSQRPGNIRKSMAVTLPQPRSHDSMATPAFTGMKQQIMDMLWL